MEYLIKLKSKMSRSLRIEFPSALYHLTSRGDIYLTDDNYRGQSFRVLTLMFELARFGKNAINQTWFRMADTY
jgi:hypothetical protein